MRKKILITSVIAILVIIIPITVYGVKQYHMVKNHVDDMQISINDNKEAHDDAHAEKEAEKASSDIHQQPLTFLLLGIGDRPDDPGRADVIMIVSVHPEKEEILTFNIPRDTKTDIAGRDAYDKINHAYAYGGTKMTKNTVEDFLDHEVDHVVQINMQGFRDLVDAIGGVEVNNDFAFSQEDELGKRMHHYKEGTIQLDGERALHYTRMRKQDPDGDLGRNQRQKQVIQAILKKAKSPKTLFSLNDTMNALSDNMKMTINFSDIKGYFKAYQSDWSDYPIDKVNLNVEEDWEPGGFYYLVTDEEQERIQALLKDFIEHSSSMSHSHGMKGENNYLSGFAISALRAWNL